MEFSVVDKSNIKPISKGDVHRICSGQVSFSNYTTLNLLTIINLDDINRSIFAENDI